MRWSLLCLEMRMRTLQGSHWGWLLVLRLLGSGRMHDLVTELLKLLLKLQVRISQVLVLLLGGWRAIVVAVRPRSSTHLGIWVAVIRSHSAT
jgi:hypothetical protein